MEITKTNEEKIQQLEEENKKIKESFKKLKSKYDGAAELLKIFEINEKSKKKFLKKELIEKEIQIKDLYSQIFEERTNNQKLEQIIKEKIENELKIKKNIEKRGIFLFKKNNLK
jgi:hypothetical protein